MATDDESLGKIHREFNSTLKEAIADNLLSLDSEFKPSDNDTENFMKIDVANHKRDVDYLLSVFKCEDSVYVSRALKRCSWLVTEPQYAQIINPQYLQQHLFPHMTTKNYIKLMKHIKLSLKDETRAEQFYLSMKIPKEAVTWLPLCSVSFIENNVARHLGHDTGRGKLGDLKVRSFKKLCEKSNTIFEIVMNETNAYGVKPYLEAVTFLLHTDVDLYLDILERVYESECVRLSGNATDMIMKHSPKRVIDKFEKYISCIHVPTFARHLKGDYVKTFLYEQAKKELEYYDRTRMSDLYNVYLKYFINRLSKDEQFKFVKDVFIDRVYSNFPKKEILPHTEAYGMMKLCDATSCDLFSWYEYATFETAIEAYTEVITENPDTYDKYCNLSVLVKCADHNLQHIRTVLNLFLDEHESDSELNYYKFNFINNLLSITHINNYDEITWNLLNQIYKAMDVYKENNEDDQQCVESIVIYSTLHDLPIPAIIQNKFSFSTLTSYKSTMNQEQKDKMFSYLYEYLISLLKEPAVNEEQFSECVKIIENVLRLFLDWDKELVDYPFVLQTINEFVKIKKEHLWKTNLSALYNINKKWRRLMCSASLSLCASEETCLNALKHEPRLLAQHSAELHALNTAADVATPRRLLAKLRIYWPHTIAREWTDEYFKILNDVAGNKALLRGICMLLPREQLMNTIKENAPEKARIDWNEADERTIALRRFIASNMHVGRPQPTPDAILLYAKGDYLKFALPSLLAILYNIDPTLFRVNIPKILDAPVSLQKHGLRFVYRRCNGEEVKRIFLNCWKTSKNLSIRAVIFYFTHTLLCNEKDDTKVVELWKLIETFIENLSFEEDKKIYELLFKVENVPLIVRGKYLMKSYYFLQQFLPNAKSVHVDYESRVARLGEYARNIMDLVSSDFVISLIKRFMDKEYFNQQVSASNGMIQVISAYLLSAKDETIQTQRYEDVLLPIMQRSLQMFNENPENKFGGSNLQALITCLSNDLKEYVVQNNKIVPKKMFVAIQNELIKSLSIQRNYLLITEWKLLVALTKLAEEAYSSDNKWSDICNKTAVEFGKKCLEYLKEDMKLHFPCIYLLYLKALNKILNLITDDDAQIVIYEQLLTDIEFIEGHLVAIQLIANANDCYTNKYDNIRRLLLNHTSVEVRFHFRNLIRDNCY